MIKFYLILVAFSLEGPPTVEVGPEFQTYENCQIAMNYVNNNAPNALAMCVIGGNYEG